MRLLQLPTNAAELGVAYKATLIGNWCNFTLQLDSEIVKWVLHLTVTSATDIEILVYLNMVNLQLQQRQTIAANKLLLYECR